MKKIVLFGAQGMLGSEIFEQSIERVDIDIIPLSRFNADLQNPEEIENIIEKFSQQCDVFAVVNTAAFTNVDKCEDPKYQETIAHINAIAPGVMAKKCSEKNIPFYHFSTDYVFDGKSDQKFTEKDSTHPCNEYGKSKAAGEKNVLSFPGSKVIRTAWLTGTNGVNFVHKMLHLSKNVDTISVVLNEKGSPSFVPDVASALLKLILHPEEYTENIYHLVNSGSASRRELVEEMQSFLGLKTNIIDVKSDFFDLPAKRPISSVLENTLFPHLPSWQEGLHNFLSGEKEKLDKKRAIEEKKERAKKLYRQKQEQERREREE